MTQPDLVEELVSQWSDARPDLNFEVMGLYARLNRFVLISGRDLEEQMQRCGISTGEFDVLATLRRTGLPYTLKPSVLARQVMLTAAGMTSRLDKLEAAGFVKRFPDPEDRRSAPVGLTAAGIRLIDKLVVVHLNNEERLFETLVPAQRKQLDAILRALSRPTG